MSSSHNSSRRSFLKKAVVAAYVAPVILSTQAHATTGRNGSAQACVDDKKPTHAFNKTNKSYNKSYTKGSKYGGTQQYSSNSKSYSFKKKS